MKLSFLILLCFLGMSVKSQMRELLIDTVVIQSYKQEVILSTIEKSKQAFKKHYDSKESFHTNFKLEVDNETIAKYDDAVILPQGSIRRESLYVKQAFTDRFTEFEFSPSLFFINRLRNATNFSNLYFIKNPHLFNIKMRKVEDYYQMTFYSKRYNKKAVVLIDAQTFFPKAVFQSNEVPTIGVSQTSASNAAKGKMTKVTYDVKDNSFTLIYHHENNKIKVETFKSLEILNNYHINNQERKYEAKFDNITAIIHTYKNNPKP